MNVKISIVTVVKNGMPYLQDCLASAMEQKYSNKEIIVVASQSNDSTNKFLLKNKKKINKLIIGSKLKLYEAINKGIKLSTGEYIIILHSDDIFFNKYVLKNVAEFIKKKECDIVFGNIIFVSRENINKISRSWISNDKKNYQTAIKYGWTPPHTSMFVKKKIYQQYSYKVNYKISSDYDFIAKSFSNINITKKYTNIFVSIMRDGGISNANIKNLFLKLKEDMDIIKKNNINFIALIIKRLSKIDQFFPSIFKTRIALKISKNILDQNKILITKNINVLNKTSGFIYSALNLAFLGFLNKIKPNRNYILWPDGIGSKIINFKIRKTPGRDIIIPLLKNLKYSNILVLGNYNTHINNFLRKYTKKISYFKIPFGNMDIIQKSVDNLKIKKKELIFINIPTPKQEMLANYIFEKNNETKIICIGGGLNMAAGIEKSVPLYLDKIGLEFLWRLRKDTTRRLFRLILSFLGIFYNYTLINKITKNFKILKS
jgi:glycosyltransferase